MNPMKTPVGSDADGSGVMFDAIAPRYDLLNRILSLGLDQSWRRKLVAAVTSAGERHVLDLATGTADVAIAIARTSTEVRVTGIDPSAGMLAVGEQKCLDFGLAAQIKLVVGDGCALELQDDSCDGVTIAFGIRNVSDRLACLREMRRVTRPGGTVAILELGEPREGILAPAARFHVRHVVPTLGAWLSGAKEYRYLQTSVAAFPPAEEFADLMRQAGLQGVEVERLSFGAAHLYTGRSAV